MQIDHGAGSQNDKIMEDPAKKLPSLMSLKIDNPDDEKKTDPSEVVLPKALEDVLALKTQRAIELGGDETTVTLTERNVTANTSSSGGGNVISAEYADVDAFSEDETDLQLTLGGTKHEGKLDKNKRKKKRKKQNKLLRRQQQNEQELKKNEENGVEKEEKDDVKEENDVENVEIEYVPEKVTIADLAPMYRQFYRVFEIFKLENKPKEQLNADASVSIVFFTFRLL